MSASLQPALTTTSVPLHQLQILRSPSEIPAWARGPEPSPVFLTTPSITTVVPQPPPGILYGGGVDGTLFSPPTTTPHPGNPGHDRAVTNPIPPKFYKLEFTTYDSTEDLDAVQKAELFVGGLPDHIRIDVALRAPQDLHTVVYLARAFELRANSLMAQFPTGPSAWHGSSSGSPRPRPHRAALHSRPWLPCH
jgi:hypothetical protein